MQAIDSLLVIHVSGVSSDHCVMLRVFSGFSYLSVTHEPGGAELRLSFSA